MAPFAWSTYEFAREGDRYKYQQTIGASVAGPMPAARWTGREIVAFRLHLPSKITYHNAGTGNMRRGNILVWEQNLADRLRGAPLCLEARMETQSILARTLALFAAMGVLVVLTFIAVIWFVKSRKPV